jgi:5-(carboxyamino)imidazole ribonucleotide synthase
MLVQQAQRMGYRTAVLEPEKNCPAGEASSLHIASAYNDGEGLAQLAAAADAITCEFENVPAFALRQLAKTRPVAPAAECVAIAQDRLAEKSHFVRSQAQSGVGPAPYAPITTAEECAAAPDSLFPAILKTARMGYDGKGQVRIASKADLPAAWQNLNQAPCVLEKMLPLQAECSVLVARGQDGAVVHLPVQLNTHHQGILAKTEVFDGALPKNLEKAAQAAAKNIAIELNYVGVLCVEFFVVQGNDGDDGQAHDGAMQLVVNEMAPRPHNSGHWSMDGSDICQFELQVRTLAGLPLVQPVQHSAAVMLNILGDCWFAHGDAASNQAQTPPWHEVLALPGAHLHLYGKLEPRRGRKMGHITFTGQDAAKVQAAARQAAGILQIAGAF